MKSLTFNKLKLKLVALFVLLSAGTLTAQNNTTRFFIPYDYEDLTVDDTAGGVALDEDKVQNPSNPIESAQLITFSVSCASGTSCNIRFTLDGTAPTTTAGILVSYGMIVNIYQHNAIQNFRAIRESSTSAVINVQYFR